MTKRIPREMNLKAVLKKRNRTLLELVSGIVFLGLTGIAVVLIIVLCGKFKVFPPVFSWIFGILTAIVSALDMYRTLDKALDLPEGDARKKIYFGYLKRYVILGILIAIFCMSDRLNPIAFFAAYMCLKIAAYMQPLTHKIYNAYFGETDPVPMSQEVYDALHPELVPENEKPKDKEHGG